MKPHTMMNVLLISGFLGAGKTTLIRHFLKSKFSAEEKVAVIVNEVGKIGFDGVMLSGQDVDIVELTSGCICCTIKTDFFKAIQEIYRTIRPTHLVVEATGVAQPGDMFDVLFDPPVKDFSRLKNMITVVDAGFFEAREVLGPFYDNQIKCADTLVLNKIDEVEDQEVERIQSVLRELNPGADVFCTQYGAVDPRALLGEDIGAKRERFRGMHRHSHHEQRGFHTFVFECKRIIGRERLTAFLDSLPPSVFRCKGWVRFEDGSRFLSFTGGRYRIDPIKDDHETSLVFVGRNCDEREILIALKNSIQ